MGINDGVGAVNGKCNLSTYYMYVCKYVSMCLMPVAKVTSCHDM